MPEAVGGLSRFFLFRLLFVWRAAWMIGAGSLIVMAAAFLPWSRQPSAAASYVNTAGDLVLAYDPHWTESLMRLTALLAGLYFLLALARGTYHRRSVLRAAWVVLAFLASFPALQNQWAVDTVMERRLLLLQMERVVVDTEDNFIHQQMDWRSMQQFDPDALGRIPFVSPPESTLDGAFFSPGDWDRPMEELLGVSVDFLGFFKPSVLLVMLGGGVLLLMGLHLASDLPAAGLRREMLWGLGALVAFYAVPVVPRLVGEMRMVQGDEAISAGDLPGAAAAYESALYWKPTLAWSWWYYHQAGTITKLQDRATSPVALVADAYTAVSTKHHEVAVQLLGQAEALAPGQPAVHKFLWAALVEAGVTAFNHGQYGKAKDYWLESLRWMPIDPMPWYGLTLVHMRLHDWERAAQAAENMHRLHVRYGFQKWVVPSQVYIAACWAAYHRGDLATAHKWYNLALTPDNW
jgi:tetratricopeptide (TPR) repeat protein